jgi:site-specific recombinase XerD
MTSKKNAKTKAKSRSKKAPGPRKAAPTATSPTLADVAEGFLADLEKRGKSASTIASYRADLGIALRHFGAETKATSITPKQVEAFNTCAAVTKTRAGRAKAKPGVEKTRRVLRLALVWAAGAGLIATAPIPEKTSAKS